jgi:translocator protein
MNLLLSHILAIAIVAVVGLLPSNIMRENTGSPWYKCIKPSITPPNIVFPIVWTVLYIMIAMSLAQAFMVKRSRSKTLLLAAFITNLILNVLWSFAYFGWKQIGLALSILIGIILTLTPIIFYSKGSGMPKWAVFILIPYAVWLCFAFVLNILSLSKVERCAHLKS